MDRKWEWALLTVMAGAALAAPARADSFAEFGKSQQGAPPAVEEDRDGATPKHDADSATPRSGHHTKGIASKSDDDSDAPAPNSNDANGTAPSSTHDSNDPAPRRDESLAPPEAESEDAAPAPTPEDPWTSHRFTLELQLGAGTPIGGIGMAGTYTVADELSFGAGLGVGSGANGPGPHAAVFALLRPAHGMHNALVIDTALSTGSYVQFDPLQGLGEGTSSEQTVAADWAHFIQIAVGWEYRSSGGAVVRITSGWAEMLNPAARKCTATNYATGAEHSCAVQSDTEELGTFELALGHAF